MSTSDQFSKIDLVDFLKTVLLILDGNLRENVLKHQEIFRGIYGNQGNTYQRKISTRRFQTYNLFTVDPLDDDVDDEMDDFEEVNHVNLGNIVGHAHMVSMAPSAPSSSSRIHSAQ